MTHLFCTVIRLGLGHLGHRGLKHLYAWPGRVKKDYSCKIFWSVDFHVFCPALQIFTLASKILLSLIKNLCYGIKKCGVLQKWSPGRAGWRALPSPPPVQPATQLSSLTRPANQLFEMYFIGNLRLSESRAQRSFKEEQNMILFLRSCKNIVCSSNQQSMPLTDPDSTFSLCCNCLSDHSTIFLSNFTISPSNL